MTCNVTTEKPTRTCHISCELQNTENSYIFPVLYSNLFIKNNVITSHIGCGHLYSFDGNWKLVYPVCMFRVPKEVTGFSHHLRYVDTCPNEPVCGHAFCEVHCNEAEEKKIQQQNYVTI